MTHAIGERVRLRALAVLALTLIVAHDASAQIPHLEGRVTVDPPRGILDGSLCTTGFAPRNPVRFLLSAALNVKEVTDGRETILSYSGDFNGTMVGESRMYVVSLSDSAPPLTTLCVSYRGAVPVFDSNTAASDWKGRIASTRGTLRAAEQARWYPTLFDSLSGRDEQIVSYRLDVSCGPCDAIYVNGSVPVKDTIGRFESAVPRALLLMAGRFPASSQGGASFVGGHVGSDAARVFAAAVRDIGDYYAQLLGEPYRERPVFLTFHSVARYHRPGSADWAFVTWPTIAFSGGLEFDSLLVHRDGAVRLPTGLWSTLSHEMGHYYFGTLKRPNGPLRWLVLESTAEYLALKSIMRFEGRAVQATRVANQLAELGGRDFASLDRIQKEDEIDSDYRYRFAPLLLLALEGRVGEERVLGLLRALLVSPEGETADFDALARAAKAAGIGTDELTGSTIKDLRRALMPAAHSALEEAAADSRQEDAAVALAVALINVDTMPESLVGVLANLRRIVTRSPGNLAAHYQIGKVGALTGREPDAALASLERYLQASVTPGSPSHAAAHWRIGMIEEHRQRLDRARAAYHAALAIDPNFAAARAALARLAMPSQ